MKILFTTNYPSPYRVNFFNELGKYCDLTVLFEETPEEQTHRDTAWFVMEYKNFKSVFLKHYILQKPRQDRTHTVIALSILKYVKKDYDYIIVGCYHTMSSMLAILYMRARGIKFWIESDGGMKKDGRGIKEKFKKLLIGGASGYFSPSRLTDEYLSFYGADCNRIYRYPFTSLYSKDILQNPPSEEEKGHYKNVLKINERKVVLSVGQFIPRKGFDILIKAAGRLDKDTGFYIVGGNPSKYYIDLVQNENVSGNVHFINFVEKQELKKYYLASDVFVLPTRKDIWGLVINEAMSCGLPVISTDACGAAMELVEDNVNGYIVKTDDPDLLANSINSYFKMDTNKSKFARNSIDKITGYTYEKMAETHINVLSRAMLSSKTRENK